MARRRRKDATQPDPPVEAGTDTPAAEEKPHRDHSKAPWFLLASGVIIPLLSFGATMVGIQLKNQGQSESNSNQAIKITVDSLMQDNAAMRQTVTGLQQSLAEKGAEIAQLRADLSDMREQHFKTVSDLRDINALLQQENLILRLTIIRAGLELPVLPPAKQNPSERNPDPDRDSVLAEYEDAKKSPDWVDLFVAIGLFSPGPFLYELDRHHPRLAQRRRPHRRRHHRARRV